MYVKCKYPGHEQGHFQPNPSHHETGVVKLLVICNTSQYSHFPEAIGPFETEDAAEFWSQLHCPEGHTHTFIQLVNQDGD